MLSLSSTNDHGASRATPANESLLAPDRSLPPTPSRGEGGKRALRDFHSKKGSCTADFTDLHRLLSLFAKYPHSSAKRLLKSLKQNEKQQLNLL
jgi:hypothetical protein